MSLGPTAPEMTFLLVMLHTGTMFAVIVYFWSSWGERYLSLLAACRSNAQLVIVATVLTGVVGIALLGLIEHVVLRGSAHAKIEHLFVTPYVVAA